jgi:ribonuclease HI
MVGTAPGPFFVFKSGKEDVVSAEQAASKTEMEYIGAMSALSH